MNQDLAAVARALCCESGTCWFARLGKPDACYVPRSGSCAPARRALLADPVRAAMIEAIKDWIVELEMEPSRVQRRGSLMKLLARAVAQVAE